MSKSVRYTRLPNDDEPSSAISFESPFQYSSPFDYSRLSSKDYMSSSIWKSAFTYGQVGKPNISYIERSKHFNLNIKTVVVVFWKCKKGNILLPPCHLLGQWQWYFIHLLCTFPHNKLQCLLVAMRNKGGFETPTWSCRIWNTYKWKL